ncbi:MAG: hypothetical protein AAFT19_08455 [Pseudomonadota bacterium]
MIIKAVSGFAIVASLALTSTPLRAEPGQDFCYWDAEGVPYSMPTPDGAGVTSGRAWDQLFVLQMNHPHLAFVSLCGATRADHLSAARERFDDLCPSESSLMRMIEGLANRGPIIVEGMSFLEALKSDHPEELAKVCEGFEDVEPFCFRVDLVGQAEVDQRTQRDYPQCFDNGAKRRVFTARLTEVFARHEDLQRRLSREDRKTLAPLRQE